jgi:hypothetical protein
MTSINLRSLCISLVLGSLLALVSFSVASADGPIIIGPTHIEGSFELGDCGSFKIIDNYEFDLTRLRFPDEAGHIVRVIAQVQGTDTFTNSVTGKAYSGSYHNTLIIDFREHAGTQIVEVGITYIVTVPGVGAALLDIGLVANLTFHADGVILAGPHQVLEDGDLAGLCAALA